MKKFLSICSFWICLFLMANIYANPSYGQQDYPQPCPYTNQCVGRCEDPCVGRCDRSCWGGRFYVGAFGGANWLNFHHHIHDFKPKIQVGYAAALSLGYKFNNGFRVEGEVAYRRNRTKDEKVADYYKLSSSAYSWSYMTNFLYDFDCVSCYLPNIIPYVGLGVGYTHIGAHASVRSDDAHFSEKATSDGLAGQAIGGVNYRLTNDTSLGLEYRYFVGREHARDHSLGLALRQSF